jgi:hypothetical protein
MLLQSRTFYLLFDAFNQGAYLFLYPLQLFGIVLDLGLFPREESFLDTLYLVKESRRGVPQIGFTCLFCSCRKSTNPQKAASAVPSLAFLMKRSKE